MSGHVNFHTIGGFTTLHLPANPPLGGNIDVAGSRKAIASAAPEVKARLDEAIAHAKALEKKGHVVSEAAWFERDVQRQIVGKIQSMDRGEDGKVPKLKRLPKVSEKDPDIRRSPAMLEMEASFQYISDGYFTRDFVRAIAKPGWFDVEITLPQDSAQSRQPVGGN